MTGVRPDQFAPVAVTTRSGLRESVHHAAVVGLHPDGSVAFAIGDPHVTIYPRSSNKPMQAHALVELGWAPTDEQLAVACASHAGTPRHVDVVESILTDAGLSVADLANTPALPLDTEAAYAVLRAGDAPSALLQNCSGKHAAMLATCAVNGWAPAEYLADDHPVQRAITAGYADLTGQAAGSVHGGVDGCGAPTHAASLAGTAAAYGRLAAARGAVWRAMSSHPDLVDGEGRVVTRMMQAVPGLMAKIGAEGVFAAGLPDGRAVAVKVADGTSRAVGAVTAAALRRLGVGLDPADFADPILGHGHPVGAVELLF